jgi:hypothetical protein
VSYPNHCILQQISPKANWGNHTIYDSDGSPFPVYPMSTLIDLIKQLKPRQWEKILTAATEASKVNLGSEAHQNPSSSSASFLTSQDRPKPQLRDDDSNVDMD